jgi:hypothetical protein
VVLEKVGPFERLDLTFPAGTDPERADVHLLVGPNGTGKSSILAAIAQCFTPADTGFFLRAREHGRVFVESDAVWTAVSRNDGPLRAQLEAPGDGWPLTHQSGAGRVWLFGRDQWSLARADLAALRSRPVSGTVVLTGGGLRSARNARISGIQEQADNPLLEGGVIDRTGGAGPVAQWIANTYAADAMARRKGDSDKAANRARSLRVLETALGDVTGTEVRLDVETEPWQVNLSMNGRSTPVESLPDGMQSLLAWLGDVLMRLDRIPWATPMPVNERPFVLLLDEVEVHLHPSWQRMVLPVAERLFPNAQIIAATHSPFVIGSASDAYIHRLRFDGDRVVADLPLHGQLGVSQSEILRDVMGVQSEFDPESEAHLSALRAAIADRLAGDAAAEARVAAEHAWLRNRSLELGEIADHQVRLYRRQVGAAASAS